MKWNTHQDMENRAYVSILTTLFPEQTKTLPRILVWSVIFFLDLTVIVFGEAYLDLLPGDSFLLLIAVIFGVFWLQGFLWSRLTKWFRSKKEEEWL